MTGNLAEFIKVFFIVFSFSAGILALRRFMLSYDHEQQEVEDKKAEVINLPKKTQGRRKTIASPDYIDYDGIGNQGRFPVSDRK